MLQKEKIQWKPLALTALVTGVALLAAYAVLGIFPFGDGSVITGDLNSQYIPYFAHYRDAAWGSGGFATTFEKSLGGSLTGIFAYYCSSLFNWIYLVIPVSMYAQAACVVLWFKLVLAAVLFACFVGQHYKQMPAWAQVVLGTGYGLCAYNLVYSQNIMWHDGMLLLPLLCMGIDRLVRKGRPMQYAIVLLLIIYSNFYIGYMACIFAVLYLIWLLCTEYPKHIGRVLGQFTVASLAGGLINGWLIMPLILDLNKNKGDLLAFSFSLKPKFSLPALVQQLLPGCFVWQDAMDGLPNLYCGILAVLLASSVFLCGKQIAKKEKLASGAILLFLVLSFWVEGLDTIWHGMKAPVWFPYRYSFLVSFWILFLAAGAAARIKWNRTLVIKTLVVWGAVLGAAVLFRKPGVVYRYLAFGAAATVVLAWIVWQMQKKHCFYKAVVLLCAVEMAANSALVLKQFELYTVSEYQQYVTQGKQTVQALHAQDSDFYRMEKTGIRTLNDPMLLGYWGVSHFGSTQDNSSVDLLIRLGYGNYASCNTYYHGSTPVADSLLGIRYIAAEPNGFAPPYGYTPVAVDSPWPVYQNPYALPMAGVVDGEVADLPLENGEDLFLWQQRLLAALAHEPNVQVYTAAELETVQPNQLKITTQKAGPCYAFLVTGTASAVTVNGQPMGSVNDLDRGGLMFLGDFAAGQVVDVQLDKDVIAAYCYSLDEAELLRVSSRIRENAPQIHQMQDGKISVTAQAGANQMLWIPTGFADAWSAKVNGQTVAPVPLAEVCLGVPLTEGENTVELVWKTPGASAGVFVSLVGLSLLFVLAIWEYKRYKNEKEDV